jgi:ABC-type glutathione transport system ATPase component
VILLSVRNLVKEFPVKGAPPLTAVDSVSFDLPAKAALAVIGDSGAGKSTLARCLVRLLEPTSGEIRLLDVDWLRLRGRRLRRHRRWIQLVFQDPRLSLNPYRTVLEHVEEPLVVHDRLPRSVRREAALEMLRRVGLETALADRYPDQLSGGQRQRVAIARAAILRPKVLLADEPTASLDAASQGAVLDLLGALGSGYSQGLVVITHDLEVARRLCDRALVMQAGRAVEGGPMEEVLGNPLHPATQALVAAAGIVTGGSRSPRTAPDVQHWAVEETG